MILNSFSYFAPETLEEAISLLDKNGFDVFTGDQSYVSSVKKGIAKPASLVSLRNVPGLNSVILYDGNKLEIGSATTFSAMLADSVVSSVSVLADALKSIKDPHLKNHSNVGGALLYNAPAHGAILAAFLTLDAKVTIVGAGGSRQISLENYLAEGPANSLLKGDIVRSITLTTNSNITGSFHFIDYLKSGKIICGTAVLLGVDDGSISEIRIAASGCVKVPVRLGELEKTLTGKGISSIILDDALNGLSVENLAISNPFIQNPTYLLHLLKVLIKRAILKS